MSELLLALVLICKNENPRRTVYSQRSCVSEILTCIKTRKPTVEARQHVALCVNPNKDAKK